MSLPISVLLIFTGMLIAFVREEEIDGSMSLYLHHFSLSLSACKYEFSGTVSQSMSWFAPW